MVAHKFVYIIKGHIQLQRVKALFKCFPKNVDNSGPMSGHLLNSKTNLVSNPEIANLMSCILRLPIHLFMIKK